MIITERELDIAIQGEGWFAVQDKNGNEAYTRAGNLQLTPDGMLRTANGHPVLGEDGPILLPLPLAKMEIGQDGTVSARVQGAPANALEIVGRIKLVDTEYRAVEKGNDGLFRRKDGELAQESAAVTLLHGAYEGSNVNAVSEMTTMISLQRQFELQVKMMKKAEQMDQQQNQLMRIIG